MDAKLNILKETFQSRFVPEQFLRFATEFFGGLKIINPDKDNANIPNEYKYTVDSYRHIASYTADKETLDVFAVKLQRGRTVDRARSMQRSFISKLLSNANHDGAIAAFYTDDDPRWRLSFIRLDYELAAGRVKMKLTPAKRYSYLVGENEPCHTAMEQLYPIFRDESYKPTLDKIEEAFSVERVTKDFFEQYKEKYFSLKDHLDSSEIFNEEAARCGFTSEQFAKKLMGQLAFLYFLQKKGWLGISVLPHKLTDKEYKNAFYTNRASREIIPKIFQPVSADEYKLDIRTAQSLSDDDADIVAGCFKVDEWGKGEKRFVRHLFTSCKTRNFFDAYLEPLFYEALNQKRGNNHYYKRFNCKIPFLNGGLFEPLEGYDWQYSKFEIPNDIFSNKDEKGERNADGILDIFDRYNFTMNEDEPLEREVAVDPEMLGKIFENLLDAKDRKSKGAFYTPREIVHYMCAESLINYLVGKTGVPYDDMKIFIIDGEFLKDEDYWSRGERKLPQSIFDNLDEIDKALETIKVADPAVGSGAFPLGMLSEIIKARITISYYKAGQINYPYEEIQKQRYERRQVFERYNPYRLKWDTIQNCIFAVDIEASAVDIAKLRLWLSLVVEEDLTPSEEEQRLGIAVRKDPHPLPNLDYNIMCGNSLIDEFEGVQLFDDALLGKKKYDTTGAKSTVQMTLFEDNMQGLLDDLRREQERLFGEQTPSVKDDIKKRIDRIIDNIIRAKLERDGNREGLLKYKEVLKQKTKPYFLWKLEFARVFRENGGFDVVIGNPPYIDSENMVNSGMTALRDAIKEKYDYAKGNWDIYIAFFERGINMLSGIGNLCYITPDKWISKPFGDAMRTNTISNIVSILAAGRDVFETALVDSIVTLISKSETDNLKVLEMKNKKSPIVYKRSVDKSALSAPYALDIIFSESIGLIQKLQQNEVLAEYYECENACATSDCYKLKDILFSLDSENNFDENVHMKIINTGTIGRYVSRWGYQPMKYLKDTYQFPVVDKAEFLKYFPNSYGKKSVKTKIIIKGLTLLDSCMDFDGIIIPGKSTMMIAAPVNELLYLSAIINSKLMIFFIKQKYSSSSYNGGINFTKDMINNLPFRKDHYGLITSTAKNILATKQNDYSSDTSALEVEIDHMVYDLYGLTKDEIKILEGAK